MLFLTVFFPLNLAAAGPDRGPQLPDSRNVDAAERRKIPRQWRLRLPVEAALLEGGRDDVQSGLGAVPDGADDPVSAGDVQYDSVVYLVTVLRAHLQNVFASCFCHLVVPRHFLLFSG